MMTPSARRAATTALAGSVTLLAFVACGGAGGKDAGPTSPSSYTPILTSISVTLSASSVQIRQTATASAAGLDQKGAQMNTGTVTWSTGSDAIATVSPSGTVTGVAPGQTQVMASAGGKLGQAMLTVTPPPVAFVNVFPGGATLGIGATCQMEVQLLDAARNIITGRVVAWISSDARILSVDQTGVVTANVVGSATITATSEGVSGSTSISTSQIRVASVTLMPTSASIAVGARQGYLAVAYDAGGNQLFPRTFAWSSSNEGVATGGHTANLLTVVGVSPGMATISVVSEGIRATAIVTVTSAQGMR